MRDWFRRHRQLSGAMYLYLILIALTWIATLAVPSSLRGLVPIGSDRASEQVLTLIVFTLVAAPVVMFVVALPAYSYFAFRVRGRPRLDAPQIVGTRGQVIAWIAITTLHAMLLFTWGVVFLSRADAAPAPGGKGSASDVLNVYVTGEQWEWNFTYPQYGNAQTEILEVPVDRPVYFTITSLDVVHSFSVPAWGIKEDAVPGEFTHIRSLPNAKGSYSLRCYELCGTYHSYMEAPVRVVSRADFQKWVTSLPSHGYPWGINGAGRPKSASPYPGNDQLKNAPNQVPGQTTSTTNAP